MEKIVPTEVAQHVLWHFGDTNLGIQSGSFITHLMRALGTADLANRARLALGFEDYAALFAVVRFEVEGMDRLRNAVKRAVASESPEVAL